MMAIFSDLIEKVIEVFMDDFSVSAKHVRIAWQTLIKC
jgi:hypothetical protein